VTGSTVLSLVEACSLGRAPDVAAAVDAVDRYLQERAGAGAFRRSRGPCSPADEVARYRGMAELGLASALLDEAIGGSALPEGTVLLFGERLGWWLAREPFVENVVLPAGLAQRLGDAEIVKAISRGQICCVAWQEGAFVLPAQAPLMANLTRDGRRLRLKGSKRFVRGAAASDTILVLATSEDGPVLVAVPSSSNGIARQDKTLADGSHWSEIDFNVVLDQSAVRARGDQVLEALADAVALANLALAGVLHGLQSRILAMTLEYLGTRIQFDRPIGSFQALQHRAADLYTHAQITRFLLAEAADVLAHGTPRRLMEVYGSRTKARAADAARRVAKEGIQMHGAIGFSDEYDLGLYVKRVLVLSGWLGGPDWHRRRLFELGALDEELL
jgi:alkylation response protein AidB-like acyl-CoA dehydrogenase